MPLFRTNGVATGLLVAMLLVTGAVELWRSGHEREDASDEDHRSRQVISLTRWGGIAAAFVLPYAASGANLHHDRGVVFGIGLAIFSCGVAVRWWAIRTLGDYFTFSVTTSGDQPIITSGPYRYVRHPGYTGGTVSRIGLGLALGNWLSLAVVVLVPLIGTIYRIRVEETALLHALGDDYRTYADAHKRLIPYVW